MRLRICAVMAMWLLLSAAEPALQSRWRQYSEDEVSAILMLIARAGQLTRVDQIPALIERFLEGLAFENEARANNLHQSSQYEATLVLCEWDFFRREIVLSRFDQWANIDEETMKKFYEESRNMFTLPERANFRQIMVESKEEAEAIISELKAGKDFAELARLYSKDPTAERGGERGVTPRERMHPKVAEIIFSLSPGEFTTTPLQLGAGFYLFQLIEKFPAETLPFEAVRSQIISELRKIKFSEFRESVLPKLVEEMKQKYQVKADSEKIRELAEKILSLPTITFPEIPQKPAQPSHFLP
ncbi:MAG: peptidylprolyl isomerase [bacterium JZ-2024 1]